MKIDLYTKLILTIIAGSLICLVVQNFNPVNSVYATAPTTVSSPMPQIVGGEPYSVMLNYHGLKSYNPLPVYIVEKPKKKENTEE